MAGSAAEREIRDAVAQHLRETLPGFRIIHELVVGGCRADLAAVGEERVLLVEIKSAKDKLDRLAAQMKAFQRASHETIVVADQRWWDRTPYHNGRDRCVPNEALKDGARGSETWIWPRPEQGSTEYQFGAWRFARHWSAQPEPHAARLLSLLWRAELLRECFRHQIAAGQRTVMATMIRDMVWTMTGKEIARAVCRQLRQRPFPEADPPVTPLP